MRNYDDHIEGIVCEAEESKLKASAGIWAHRLRETRERTFELAADMESVATGMLKRFSTLLKLPTVEARKHNGQTIIKPAKVPSLSEFARFVEVMTKLKHLSVGLATDRTEHSGPDGGPISVSSIQVPKEHIKKVFFEQAKREVLKELGLVPGTSKSLNSDVPPKK